MEWKIGEAIDHYILFRDTNDPTPIDYAKRLRQRDLLIGDNSSFVWGYVGELTRPQAKTVQIRFDFEFEEGFEEGFKKEHNSSAASEDTGEIMIMPNKPGALDFLVQLSPDLEFLAHAPLDQFVKIQPKTKEEEQRILAELMPRAAGSAPDFCSRYVPNVLRSSKADRSFVELLPLYTLEDIWQRVGYDPNMDVLRHTAAVWFCETLCGSTFNSSGGGCSPEETELIFRSSIDEQIFQITLRQRVAMEKSVGIVNSIREAEGNKDRNLENKYRVAVSGGAVPVPEPPPTTKRQPKTSSATDPDPTEGKEKKSRRNRVEMAKIVDACIVNFWFHLLVGEQKTQADLEKHYGLGSGTLSDGVAGKLMEAMSKCQHGFPKINRKSISDKGVLYKQLEETLKNLRQDLEIKMQLERQRNREKKNKSKSKS
jgi:hypothetical protein